MIAAEKLILAMICFEVVTGFFIVFFLVCIMSEVRDGKHDDE